MKTIISVVDHELVWSQKSAFKNSFELRFGGELVATLQFPKMFGTMGVATSGDGSWSFERQGFWKSTTVVRTNGGTDPIGNYKGKPFGGGGILTLPTGKKFVYWTGFWKRIFEFRTEEGEPLFQIQQNSAFRVSASVRINRKALSIPELPWMVLFAFYLMVMARSDAASAAAAGG